MVTLKKLDKIVELRNTALELIYLTEEYFELQVKKRKEYIRDKLLKFEKEFNKVSNTHHLSVKVCCSEYYITLCNNSKTSKHLISQLKFDRTNVNLHICKFVNKEIANFVKKTLEDIIQ